MSSHIAIPVPYGDKTITGYLASWGHVIYDPASWGHVIYDLASVTDALGVDGCGTLMDNVAEHAELHAVAVGVGRYAATAGAVTVGLAAEDETLPAAAAFARWHEQDAIPRLSRGAEIVSSMSPPFIKEFADPLADLLRSEDEDIGSVAEEIVRAALGAFFELHVTESCSDDLCTVVGFMQARRDALLAAQQGEPT